MAFLSRIITAQNLKKLQKNLIEEKEEAIKKSEDASFKTRFKFSHIAADCREGLVNCLKKCFRCREESCGYIFCYKLRHEGSLENFIVKSLLGFFGGILLTYLLYFVFIFQLNIQLTSATIICGLMGCILTVGLAFSSRVRCVVLLTLPQFFSKRGRQALLAYAFVLALTGPAQNTLNNMGILAESMACGQEQLKQAVKQIIDVIKKPFMAIKEAIKKVVKTVREVVKKIKEILMKIKRIVMALVRVIKSVFEFLGKLINICNKELGTPFERCSRVFENAIADCNAKLGPLFNWLCSLTYIVKSVCYIVKIFDYVCILVDFISNSVIGVIIRKIKIFVRHIKTMFYVRIKFSHSFEYKTTSSKSFTEIAKEIVAEIKGRTRGVVAFFKFMTSASMMFFLYLVFQVAYYRIKYLSSERFDNFYITHIFREIDLRRAKVAKETVLPLTKKERQTYVAIGSSKLAKKESRDLSKAATTLATATVKLGTHMVADYCLFWILTMISRHARYQSKVQAPNFPVAHISGEGFLARLLRSIVDAFQPAGIKLEIDTVPCLPIPIPPDYDRYVQIGVTILICWVLTLLEPYGLRFRNYIMGYYHPVRAKQRTIWLYNHILRSRTTFLTLARRKLRKKFGMKGGSDEISCKEWFKSKLRCGIFRICLGPDLQKTCLLCGEPFRESNKTRFVKCHTPECPGLFCLECFNDLDNICPICLSPLECGDIDDLDEEKDSSEDEPSTPKKKCRWCSCCKPEADDDKPKEDPQEDEPDESESKGPDDSEEHGAASDSSTDLSFSYQYQPNEEPLPSPSVWTDVEKQNIPDEASMETFQEGDDYINVDLENTVRVPPGYRPSVHLEVSVDDEDIELMEVNPETLPLLSCSCSNSSPRRVEFIGLPAYCDCSDDQRLTSTMSTSTKSDCMYCHCESTALGTETEEDIRNVVPALNLSFDDHELGQKFCNIKYQEEDELSPRTTRSLESSSVLSSLRSARPIPIRRCITTQESSSSSNFELCRAQAQKVRQYYEATSKIHPVQRTCPPRQSVMDMFKNFIPKRKKDQNYLPLHDDVRIQSYNYNQDYLDSLNNSPTYPFEGSSDDEQGLLYQDRFRGGECGHFTCRLSGRCRKRVRSFDARSSTQLTTLSLPAKPRPVTNLLFNIEQLKPPGEIRQYMIQDSGTQLVAGDGVSGTSDSFISESTCVDLFGHCPQGFGTVRGGLCGRTGESWIEADDTSQTFRDLVVGSEEALIETHSSETKEIGSSIDSYEVEPTSSQLVAGTTPDQISQDVGRIDEGSLAKSSSLPSVGASSKGGTVRKSAQLNQLLYKDDKTEISLVQNLSPHKETHPTPPVKLKISLHNTFIADTNSSLAPMNSQDKIVETNETYPVTSCGDSTNDKIQQTSDNDLFGSTKNSSTKSKCSCPMCTMESCQCCRCQCSSWSPKPAPLRRGRHTYQEPPLPPIPPVRVRCKCCGSVTYSQTEDDEEYKSPELPYQDSDEYFEMVHELQKTLHSRNKDRVRRAMREFENRSKMNKPLDKPIINYDETSENEDEGLGDRCMCCMKNCPPSDLRGSIGERPSHWTMDPSSGEWYKASMRNQEPQKEFKNSKKRCNCNCEHRYQ